MIDLLAKIADRRAIPRLAESSVRVTLRVPGQLGTSSGQLIDFNRHGLAVCLAGPSKLLTPKVSLLTVSLRVGDYQIRNAQAVVHNRLQTPDGLRLGIRFRVETSGQLDAGSIAQTLVSIESLMQADRWVNESTDSLQRIGEPVA